MPSVHIDSLGEMAIVECAGRFVRNDAALKLRDAVKSQEKSSYCDFGPHGDAGNRRWGTGDAVAFTELGSGQRYSIQTFQPFRARTRQAEAR